jgi:kynurenine formamidase
MNEWIDLTILVDDLLPSYPGDKDILITEEFNLSNAGFNLLRIETNMHKGTHLDAKKHVFPVEEGVESIDINKMIGKALVIRPVIENGTIKTKSIIDNYNEGYQILILDLSWGKLLYEPTYFNHPTFERDILTFLLDNKINVIGFDIPSPCYDKELEFEMHKDLLKNDITIIENLTNLESLDKVVDFICLPLKIKGFDGSFVRCVAKNINIG